MKEKESHQIKSYFKMPKRESVSLHLREGIEKVVNWQIWNRNV